MTHSIGGRVRRLAAAGAAAAVASLALAGAALADATSSTEPFVIGGQNVAVGDHVTFWGAQWWQNNTLTGGLAPAAFKGFVDSATPNCGDTWTTDPGNSSHPPATVGSTVEAIVSSQITQSGSAISGDVAEVVTITVDPGYAGDPGHPGTGEVSGIICGGILAG